MSSEWKMCTLGDILTLQRGMDLPSQNRRVGTIPIIGSNGIVGYHNKAAVQGPGVVIGRSGSIGGGQYTECDFWPLNTTLWVKDFKGNHPLFCYYLLRSIDFSALNAGSGVPTLNRNHLHPMELLCPPVIEQVHIATILGTIDERITSLRETNATLESIAQALFKSWFIDFDPVHAKADGCDPAGMDAETAALFPDGFEESELGVIPKGWRVGTLSDLAILNPESWSNKSHPDTILYIDLANTKDNIINEITEYIYDSAPSRARRVLRNGDTIIGTVRPGNRSFALINNAPLNLTGSTGFAVLRPSTVANTEFIYSTIITDANIDYLRHVADGGAYPAVRPEVVLNLKVIIPSSEIIEIYHSIAKPLLLSVSKNQQKIQYLTGIRNTLLPKLISGQICLLPDKAFL